MFSLDLIRAGYGGESVLDGVSLVVPDGAVVALLGANGAGKTTLLRVASGLLEPISGRVLIDAEDCTGAPADELARRGVCHVPEGRGVFPALTVRENLRLQAPHDIDDDGLRAVAEAFRRLGERLDQRAGTLSGGEQQMLALAHAYVSDPKVVLLDEVSMGLAPKIIDEIFEHVASLRRRGLSLLLVEQYVGRALAVADFVYILRKGSIAFAGEPAEIRRESILAAYLGETA